MAKKSKGGQLNMFGKPKTTTKKIVDRDAGKIIEQVNDESGFPAEDFKSDPSDYEVIRVSFRKINDNLEFLISADAAVNRNAAGHRGEGSCYCGASADADHLSEVLFGMKIDTVLRNTMLDSPVLGGPIRIERVYLQFSESTKEILDGDEGWDWDLFWKAWNLIQEPEWTEEEKEKANKWRPTDQKIKELNQYIFEIQREMKHRVGLLLSYEVFGKKEKHPYGDLSASVLERMYKQYSQRVELLNVEFEEIRNWTWETVNRYRDELQEKLRLFIEAEGEYHSGTPNPEATEHDGSQLEGDGSTNESNPYILQIDMRNLDPNLEAIKMREEKDIRERIASGQPKLPSLHSRVMFVLKRSDKAIGNIQVKRINEKYEIIRYRYEDRASQILDIETDELTARVKAYAYGMKLRDEMNREEVFNVA